MNYLLNPMSRFPHNPNQKSIQIIERIVRNITHPVYPKEAINARVTAQASDGHVEVTLFIGDVEQDCRVNHIWFCFDSNGDIESIAIFWEHLHEYLQELERTHNIFNLEVKSFEYDDKGNQPFIDIYLQ